MDNFFKAFIECDTTLLLFYFFGWEACGILVPQTGIQPAIPTLEGKVPTTGPPGKSPLLSSLHFLPHSILTTASRKYDLLSSPHFADEKTEAKRL